MILKFVFFLKGAEASNGVYALAGQCLRWLCSIWRHGEKVRLEMRLEIACTPLIEGKYVPVPS